MNDLLPLVNEEVRWNLDRAVMQYDDDKQLLISEITNLQNKNPVVANFIAQFAIESHDMDNCAASVTLCGIMVYKLLESQAEANRMAQEIALE